MISDDEIKQGALIAISGFEVLFRASQEGSELARQEIWKITQRVLEMGDEETKRNAEHGLI